MTHHSASRHAWQDKNAMHHIALTSLYSLGEVTRPYKLLGGVPAKGVAAVEAAAGGLAMGLREVMTLADSLMPISIPNMAAAISMVSAPTQLSSVPMRPLPESAATVSSSCMAVDIRCELQVKNRPLRESLARLAHSDRPGQAAMYGNREQVADSAMRIAATEVFAQHQHVTNKVLIVFKVAVV